MARTSQDAHRSRPSRIGLPRPTGTAWALMLFGLALLGAAINTGNNLLYLLFGLVAAGLPVSLSLSLWNLLRLDAALEAPATAQADTPFPLTVRLTNRRRRPARAVRVRVVTAAGVWGPALVESVPGHAERSVTLTGRFPGRGPLPIQGVRLATVFPLGLVERRRFFPAPATLLVLPVPSRGPMPVRHGRDPHGDMSAQVRRGGLENDGLRRGRPEDDARRVDWKSTARRGVLLVRESAGEARPRLQFDLGTHRPGHPSLARLAFEGEISYQAGRARQVLQAGGDVVMTLDGEEPRSYAGQAGLGPLLRRLALVEPTDLFGRPLPPAPPLRRPAGSGAASGPEPAATPPGRALAWAARAALAVAVAALFAYGGLGPVAATVLLGGLATIALGGLRRRPLRRWAAVAWQVAAALALMMFVADLLLVRRNPLGASLHLIAFIALYKLFNAPEVRDDRQILLVSLLMIVLAAALTTGVSFVLPLLAWMVAAVSAQVAWAHLPVDAGRPCRPARFDPGGGRWRYSGPIVLTTAGIVAAGALIFVAVPHLGTGTFAPGVLRAGRISGFSETTRLGDIGRIKLDRSRVMEVRIDGGLSASTDLRWRGLALDQFDGRAWSRSAGGLDWFSADGDGWFRPRGEPESPRRADGPSLRHEVRLDPSSQRVLFAAAAPDRIASDEFLFLAEDGTGAVLLPGRPGRRLAYKVESTLPPRDPARLRAASGPDPPRVRSLHLQLPPLDPRVRALAVELAGSAATRYDGAAAIEQWLVQNRPYSLQVDDAGRDDPLSAFLFEGMPGHCEYFATAMVTMARSAGIPARFVAGYLRGDRSRFGPLYTVRQSDAHSWVEVYFPEVGWVPFEPTPPAGRGSWDDGSWRTLASDLSGTVARWWDDYVIGIDLDDQARGFLALRDTAGAALSGLGARLAALISPLATRVLSGLALASLLAGAAWLLWRAPWRGTGGGSRAGALPAFYRGLLRWLARRGFERRPGETPAELAERAAATLPAPAAARVRDLTDLYYRVRYEAGIDPAGANSLGRRLLGDLRRLPAGAFPGPTG